jgi:hypothetical protein
MGIPRVLGERHQLAPWRAICNGADAVAEEPMPRTLLVKTADVLVAPRTMRDASFGAMKIYLPRLLGGAVSDDETHKGGDVIAASAARGS